MAKTYVKFILLFAAVFAIDQAIKLAFLNGFSWQGEFFSLELTFNRGVAFSMFAFLGENLKFIQIALIAANACGRLLKFARSLHSRWRRGLRRVA